MTSITKQKRLTLTERNEIVLRLDKGHPLTVIVKDYRVKKLTFTYLIILTMTSKIYFLRSGIATLQLYYDNICTMVKMNYQ